MSRYLRALPLVALLPAAVDTWLVRLAFDDYREPTPALFAQTALLWLAFGALALVPAYLGGRLTERILRRRRPEGPSANDVRAGLALLAWTVLPVATHAALDANTQLGASLSELAQPGVWLTVAAVFVGLFVAALVLGRLLAGVSPRLLALAVAGSSLAAGAAASLGGGQAPRPEAAGADERPNLLLLVWDTTRSPNLGVYGYERGTTTGLDEFAASCLVFDRARSASRFTLTSHLSMLTGVYPSHHGASLLRQTVDRRRTPSVATLLKGAGYRTGGFVGASVLRARSGMQFGFEAYDDLVDPPVCDTAGWHFVHDLQRVCSRTVPGMWFNGQPHWFQDYQRAAPEVLAKALDWIQLEDPRPWFCLINLYDVHWPHLPSPEARSRWVAPYDGPVDGYLHRSDDFPAGYQLVEADNAHLRDLYDAELSQLDSAVAGFLAQLDLDSTAVVLTSDHGEAFGEGGRHGHDDILEPQVRVPLLVRPAGADGPQPARRADPVSGVDVAPTLLWLAGLEAPAHMLGRNLLGGPFPADRAVLVEDRDHRDRDDVRLALYSGDWKLVRTGPDDGQHIFSLYDLARDPIGLEDVAALHPEVVAALEEKLVALRGLWHGGDDSEDAAPEIDEGALRALGYI